MALSIGSDPELFLRDRRTGAVVPVVGLIGGTKDEPLPMEGLRSGFALQEDNVMLEFNIPPTRNASRFTRNITDALAYINQVVRTTGNHLMLDNQACTRMFTHEQLASSQAQMFGCSPDFNAHAQGQAWPSVKPEALIEADGGWRFAGGHVHIGYESEAPDFVVAAMCDVYLGLNSIGIDQQLMRRDLYGQAGRYRPTPYGIEYRTLSNYWIWDMEETSDVARRALAVGQRVQGDMGHLQELYAEIPWPDVIDAINTENDSKAADLLSYLRNDLAMEDL